MSRGNPSSRSASSPKLEEKNFAFLLLMFDAQKIQCRSSRLLKPISLAKYSHQGLKPKKIGTSEVTDIAKCRVKHHPFRHCLSRFFTSDDDLQCPLYSTLCIEGFQRKFCESRRKVRMISYCTVLMISRAGAQRTYRIMELRTGLECTL